MIPFLEQLSRIKNMFGEQHYNEEKIDLLFKRLQFISNENFKLTVDEIILNSRFNPSVDDYLKYHDEVKRRKKIKSRDEPAIQILDNRPGSIFSKDEIRMFFATMFKAISKEIPKSDLDLLSEYINTRLKGANIKYICPKCEDTGICIEDKNGSDYAYKCNCPAGKTRPEAYPEIK